MNVYDTFTGATFYVIKQDDLETRLSPLLNTFQTEVLVEKLDIVDGEIQYVQVAPKVDIILVEPKPEDGNNPIRMALLWVIHDQCDFNKEVSHAIELSSLLQGAPVALDINGIFVYATSTDRVDNLHDKFLLDTKKFGHGILGANDSQPALRAMLSGGSATLNPKSKTLIGLSQ